MMPHPENSVEAGLAGGADGRGFFQSMVDSAARPEAAAMSAHRAAPRHPRGRRQARPHAPTSTTTSAASRSASPPTSSSPSTRSCGASTAATSTRGPSCGRFPTSGPAHPAGPRRERRHHRRGRRLGRGHEGREPQPPLARSSPSRARPPAWAASCATSSPWARGPASARLAALRRARPSARQRFLFDGVVGGIGFYGNCLGIPTVGGEVYFEDQLRGQLPGQRHVAPASCAPTASCAPSPAAPATTSC